MGDRARTGPADGHRGIRRLGHHGLGHHARGGRARSGPALPGRPGGDRGDRAPPRCGPDPGSVGRGRPGRLLPGRVRPGPGGVGGRGVLTRGPRRTLGPMGGSPAAGRLRPRAVDGAAALAGLSDPGRGPDRGAGRPPRRPGGPPVAARDRRGGPSGRTGPLRSPPRRGGRGRAAGPGTARRPGPVDRSRAHRGGVAGAGGGRRSGRGPGAGTPGHAVERRRHHASCTVDAEGHGRLPATPVQRPRLRRPSGGGGHGRVPPQPGPGVQLGAGPPRRIRTGATSHPHALPGTRGPRRPGCPGPGDRHHGRRPPAADPGPAVGPPARRRGEPRRRDPRPAPRAGGAGGTPFPAAGAPARSLLVEGDAPPSWVPGLEQRGHTVRRTGPLNPVDVGCAQIISVEERPGRARYRGASDPRSPEGAAIAW